VQTYDESFVKPRRRWWLRWLKYIAAGWLMLAILAVCMQSWRHYRISKRLDAWFELIPLTLLQGGAYFVLRLSDALSRRGRG
jgi:hypothetical protein